MNILYAEDEPAMAEAVADILTFHKYTVDTVPDGQAALDYALVGTYDGIILDVMMPKKSGIEVLTELRKRGCQTPVLLLTAKAEIEDRIEGLDAGADDYLPKPFAMGELLARVRAILRRRPEIRPQTAEFGDLTLDPATYELRSSGGAVVLPNLEYKLCETFIVNRGIYLSAEQLLTKVWGYDTDSDIGTVWVYISSLRKRFAQVGSKVLIRSKRNIGYMLEMPAE
ncbi:MAG: response regulator transcription factor [Lachnospiraceae bacterium]|nr:response regulator transcription factor [Lachnospiraceae bacterium]